MGARSSQSRGPGLNKSDGHLLEYFRQTFGAGGGGTNAPPPPNDGIVASGGVVNDYTVSSDVYRAHIFTSSGAFAVSTLSTDPNLPNNVEYLVISGGGGGGDANGGGGGAGGFRTNMPGTPHSTTSAFTVTETTYPVVVGDGGNGGNSHN